MTKIIRNQQARENLTALPALAGRGSWLKGITPTAAGPRLGVKVYTCGSIRSRCA